MDPVELEEYELDAILGLINQVHGYDFHQYARASIKRRIRDIAVNNGYAYISQLMPDILYKADFLNQFLKGMSVTVTGMFRDPWVFAELRQAVLPKLSIFPQINIWHVGCATGEEVYSMVILLKELGLLEQAQIYATDFNNHSLEIAKKGIYSLDRMKDFTRNYQAAGGSGSFSDYYQVKYDSAKLDDSLKSHIIFSNHNLVTDTVFGEMNLVICRNVLIYFNQTLQNRALGLFRDSLSPKGFLVLGDKESITFSEVSNDFDTFSGKEKIYRMK